MQSTFRLKVSLLVGGTVLSALAPLTAAAQNGTSNPGRDFNLQTYERRYDPGATSQPYYHPQNPGQQYNSQIYERRYRPGALSNPPRIVGKEAETGPSARVRSLKPARKTDEQARRAQRRKAKEDDD